MKSFNDLVLNYCGTSGTVPPVFSHYITGRKTVGCSKSVTAFLSLPRVNRIAVILTKFLSFIIFINSSFSWRSFFISSSLELDLLKYLINFSFFALEKIFLLKILPKLKRTNERISVNFRFLMFYKKLTPSDFRSRGLTDGPGPRTAPKCQI